MECDLDLDKILAFVISRSLQGGRAHGA